MADDESLTNLEEELIEFVRLLEIQELHPWQWGIAAHIANKKLNELERRGIVDRGGQRYANGGDTFDWEHQYDTSIVSE